MKKRALFDLAILAVTFTATLYYVRYYGVGFAGLLTMAAAITVGYFLLRQQGETLSSIGLGSWGQRPGWLRVRVFEAAGAIAILTWGGAMVLIPLLGPLETSSVITGQPDTFVPFLIDIIVGVWIGAALGEEIFFRGILLSRFNILFGSLKHGQYIAILAQAIWFGSGHTSQGMTGMVLTGLIGFGIGVYYVRRCEGNLWPLIVAHGLIDTLVLSITYIGDL